MIAVVSLTSHELDDVAFVFHAFLEEGWESLPTVAGPQWSTGGRIQAFSAPLVGTIVSTNIRQVQGFNLIFRRSGAQDIPESCYRYVIRPGNPSARNKRKRPEFLPSRIFTYPKID